LLVSSIDFLLQIVCKIKEVLFFAGFILFYG